MNFFKKNFFLFIFLVIAGQANANLLVISDIDDTVKTTNSVGKWHQKLRFFLKNKPYYSMRDLFVELEQEAMRNGERSEFHYVTGAPRIIFNAKKFLKKYHFPFTSVTMKKLIGDGNTYYYKMEKIREILNSQGDLHGSHNQIYFFGDNSSYDDRVYRDIIKEFGLKNAHIFIRDVKTDATSFDPEIPQLQIENAYYYLSESQIIGHPAFSFLSSGIKQKIFEKHVKKALIPSYTFKTYHRRVSYILKCKILHTRSKQCDKEKRKKAEMFWVAHQSKVERILRERENLPFNEEDEDQDEE